MALALLLVAGPAWAWGSTGHRAVGKIASRLLDDEVRRRVLADLGGASLAEASTWADEARDDPANDWMSPLHYVNYDSAEGRFTGCPKRGCVIDAIDHALAVLRSADSSKAERRLWLKLLVHFVGDLHQPLHVSRAEDRGGNEVAVDWMGQPSDLHWVWDTGILAATASDWRELSDRLVASLVDPEIRSRALAARRGSVVDWADESYRLSIDTVYPSVGAGSLGRSYAATFLPLVELRLLTAGVRLATMLESLYGVDRP